MSGEMVDQAWSCNVKSISPALDYYFDLNKAQLHEDSRNFKGYKWEMTVMSSIKEVSYVSYVGNPMVYSDWLCGHNRNAFDGVVTLPNGSTITLELKYRRVPKVYHSWFMDCWFPREADVFVCNNPSVVSYRDKRLLDSQSKKLMSLSEFIVYLGRLTRNILYPSKYLYFNGVVKGLFRLVTGMFSNIIGLGLCFGGVFAGFLLDLRLKCLDSRLTKNRCVVLQFILFGNTIGIF